MTVIFWMRPKQPAYLSQQSMYQTNSPRIVSSQSLLSAADFLLCTYKLILIEQHRYVTSCEHSSHHSWAYQPQLKMQILSFSSSQSLRITHLYGIVLIHIHAQISQTRTQGSNLRVTLVHGFFFRSVSESRGVSAGN